VLIDPGPSPWTDSLRAHLSFVDMIPMNAHTNLRAFPRLRLGIEPTPLRRAVALETHLAGRRGRAVPPLFIKHDEMTGFGLGGNKVRKLETELSGDRLEGITCLITTGGPQSNHARVTAAVAASLGLKCHIVVNGSVDEGIVQGNALLHRLFGAEMHAVASREERAPRMDQLAEDERSSGGRALVVPLGASTARGALGYARAFVEFDAQVGPGEGVTSIFVASSSGGTLAGLLLGGGISGRNDVEIRAVSADTPALELREIAHSLAGDAFSLLNGDGPPPTIPVETGDAQIGSGYGIPTPASREAADLFARHAGVVLDQTYTAKAAAELIASLDRGEIDHVDRLVFWHTGGWPAVFAEY